MTEVAEKVELPELRQGCDCSDRDEDCEDIEDKTSCWLYAPERGMCPYLRAAAIRKG